MHALALRTVAPLPRHQALPAEAKRLIPRVLTVAWTNGADRRTSLLRIVN